MTTFSLGMPNSPCDDANDICPISIFTTVTPIQDEGIFSVTEDDDHIIYDDEDDSSTISSKSSLDAQMLFQSQPNVISPHSSLSSLQNQQQQPPMYIHVSNNNNSSMDWSDNDDISEEDYDDDECSDYESLSDLLHRRSSIHSFVVEDDDFDLASISSSSSSASSLASCFTMGMLLEEWQNHDNNYSPQQTCEPMQCQEQFQQQPLQTQLCRSSSLRSFVTLSSLGTTITSVSPEQAFLLDAPLAV